jgi:hypothetical protein
MAWGLANVITLAIKAALPCFGTFIRMLANRQAKPVLVAADTNAIGGLTTCDFFHFTFL